SLSRLYPEKRTGKSGDGNKIQAGHGQPPCSPIPPIFTPTRREINCPLGHQADSHKETEGR
ncbi:MAG: hypothetical protein WCF37_20415, partial [Pseudolabrys sp.]